MRTNPYTEKLQQRGLTGFLRASLKQRERGWNDYLEGKDILAYYDAPLRPATERGRADYNLGWRAAKDLAAKSEVLAS
jgi:hypothetical protein